MRTLAIVVMLTGLLAVSTAMPDDSYLTYGQGSEGSDDDEAGQHVGKVTTNCTCGTTNKDTGRIVGGTETLPNEYPHMVGVGYINKKKTFVSIFCGGSLISEWHVLTAAHCTYQDHDELGIVAGEHNTRSDEDNKYTKVYPVRRVIEHQGWNDKTYEDDIAILLLDTKVELNRYVGLICLPTRRVDITGQHVKVTGWGHTKGGGEESDTLQKVNLRVIKLDICKEKYQKKVIRTNPGTQLCTYSYRKDSCQGDSGGPVIWLDRETNRYTQVGVVSYGAGCATRLPGVNTDVHAYIDWIQTTIHMTRRGVYTCSRNG
uniref:Venom S1 protease 6 n=2 Tax=Panheteroptera TaxID=33351 RepID=A0A2K8JLB8_9HEMI|nr:venom S1 protease 6 [Lethocerus distinctifemur]